MHVQRAAAEQRPMPAKPDGLVPMRPAGQQSTRLVKERRGRGGGQESRDAAADHHGPARRLHAAALCRRCLQRGGRTWGEGSLSLHTLDGHQCAIESMASLSAAEPQ